MSSNFYPILRHDFINYILIKTSNKIILSSTLNESIKKIFSIKL